MKARGTGGGAATAGGMDFQHRVAAWVAIHILSEKDVAPPWNLLAETTLEWLQCETEHPVDDLLIGTSNNGFVFAQIKRTLNLSRGERSDLASALDQCVRQFVASRDKSTGKDYLDRPLDPKKDRLVIITSPTSSGLIQIGLNRLLERVRSLPQHLPLNDAVKNNEDDEILSVLKMHVIRSWEKVSGANPSDDELRQFLSLIRLQVLDLDEGANNEIQAKDHLRKTILKCPDEMDVAWSLLISLCANFAVSQSGADREKLQRALTNAGIELRVVRSYYDDVELLKKYSKETSKLLSHLSRIRVGSTEVKIRRKCTDALIRAAGEKSILVVGEPGVGKSGVLHDIVEILSEQGQDHIFLAVDRLGSRSLGQLRDEIGLNHGLLEALDNWPGLQTAFLVIDALDTALDGLPMRMIQDLIRDITEKNGRWHVVASIRKFDLRYGEEIKQLFMGGPLLEFQDSEFNSVRHINVPHLSEDEIDQVKSQSSELCAFIDSTSPELYALLCVPYNLQLMASLLGDYGNSIELLPIKTQLALLEKYWDHRVICSNNRELGDARNSLLIEVCERMVAQRSLRIDRSDIIRPDESISNLLRDLLSAEVLIEWSESDRHAPDRDILAFGHNILFDYAVARLLLRGKDEKMIHRIYKDIELVIVIRPSLLLHFHRIWALDVRRFWDLVFQFYQSAEMPEIGKLIGTSVVAESARTISDMKPLISTINNHNLEDRKISEQILWHLVGTLLAGTPNERNLVGTQAGPWCDLIDQVSNSLNLHLAYSTQSLLNIICKHIEYLTREQCIAAGKAARRLLGFAWSQSPRDRWLALAALQCVCRTFESDPELSAPLIRQCLEPLRLSQFGFEEMPILAKEVERLITLDPRLVQEIYCAVFSYNETSNEKTPIGQSRIVNLTSNRRQEYDFALRKLSEVFPRFLELEPERAICTLIKVMEAYLVPYHSSDSGAEHEEIFDFNGTQARLLTELCVNWDYNLHRHRESPQILDAFQGYIEKLAKSEDCIEQLRVIVHIISSKNRLGIIWNRLLLSGGRYPCTLGREILPLGWTIPILIFYDTNRYICEFISSIFPIINSKEREFIEQAILRIPEALQEDRPEVSENIRNRLLLCLPNEYIITDEAKKILEKIKVIDVVSEDESSIDFGEMGPSYDIEMEDLREKGVPFEAVGNRKIRELEQPLKELSNKYLSQNQTPTLEEAKKIFPALRELYSALMDPAAEVHPRQCDYAWHYLTNVCAHMSATNWISKDDEIGPLVKNILLQASNYPEPISNPKCDVNFDQFPSWDLPSPRVEAAKGLILLAWHQAYADFDVLNAIEQLSKDPVAAVRFQIASSANVLYQTARKLMWKIIEETCRDETNQRVLQGLLMRPIERLANAEPDHIANITKTIFDRVVDGSCASELRGLCTDIFSDLYIWHGHVMCGEVIREFIAKPAIFPDEAHHVLMRLRKPLTYGPTDHDDPQADEIRGRTFELLGSLLHSACQSLLQIEEQNKSTLSSEWPQSEQDKVKALVRLIDSIGYEVYFASGAYDRKHVERADAFRTINPEYKRFYREASNIFNELSDLSIPSVVHHFLETLKFFIPLQPNEVFILIGRAIRSGQQSGYQDDQLAIRLMVKLIGQYLAEYRSLLYENKKCRQVLIEILDIFVQAGWPDARRLAYRLEEIFR